MITVAGAALADYYALIAYAAATLDKNTAASRRLLYERARASLVTQMRKLDPPLTESEIRREQFALEEAIQFAGRYSLGTIGIGQTRRVQHLLDPVPGLCGDE